MGEDDEAFYKAVEEVFQRMDAKRLTANADKCKFGVKEVTFFGLRMSANGVSLIEQKVAAIREFKKQNDASE